MERSFVYVFKMYSHVHEPLKTLEYACAHRSRPEEEETPHRLYVRHSSTDKQHNNGEGLY